MARHRVLTLLLPDVDTLADLATYLGRARRVDPDGAARLVGHGDVLAVYVSPVHGGGGPVILGLRALRLAVAGAFDVTVPLAALTDQLGSDVPGTADAPIALTVPAAEFVAVAWAGTSPPRSGWQAVATLSADILADAASSGIAEITTGAPPGSGAAAVATLRARVWGRPLAESLPELPAGVAFAAQALGFLDGAPPAAVYRYGPWWRLTTSSGHVLARRPALASPS